MKTIKITKDYFKDIDFHIKLPTFTCKICGETILDCPSNQKYKEPTCKD